MNVVQTKHSLDFEVARWHNELTPELCAEFGIRDDDKYPNIEWLLFRVGTCEGQWRMTSEAYEILSVINSNPGNGHLDDLLEWFEYACRRSNLPLRILAFTNDGFKKHLLEKRGFVPFRNDVEKQFAPQSCLQNESACR